MSKQILVVSNHLTLVDLPFRDPQELQLTFTSTAKDGLSALDMYSGWNVVLVACLLPDMTVQQFITQARAVSQATFVLLSSEKLLTSSLEFANKQGLFRVLTEMSSAETLEQVLLDSAAQQRQVEQLTQLRERLKQHNALDPLTGCYTRNYLFDHLVKEVRRCQRYSHYLSIILCDIDQLKEVNTLYGHRMGDRFLTGFAQSASQIIRKHIDLIGRWGEDEFLIVLPETTIRGGGKVATRLQETFLHLDYQQEGQAVSSTASFGVASFAPELPDRNCSAEDMLLIADRCLLQAKAAGGNKVLCCP